MQIELNREELTELRETLEAHLTEMHSEIIHTDDHDFREALKAKRELLRNVLRRLGGGS